MPAALLQRRGAQHGLHTLCRSTCSRRDVNGQTLRGQKQQKLPAHAAHVAGNQAPHHHTSPTNSPRRSMFWWARALARERGSAAAGCTCRAAQRAACLPCSLALTSNPRLLISHKHAASCMLALLAQARPGCRQGSTETTSGPLTWAAVVRCTGTAGCPAPCRTRCWQRLAGCMKCRKCRPPPQSGRSSATRGGRWQHCFSQDVVVEV